MLDVLSDAVVIVRMILDLCTGGDPTLPAGSVHLWPIAAALSALYDLSLSALYADDSVRFALWHVLDLLGVSGIVEHIIESAGFVVYEDYSIARETSDVLGGAGTMTIPRP